MPAAKELKVLLVDGDMRMRQVTRFGLSQLGITQIEDAANGAAAIQSLEDRPVHLVMCEQKTPGMSGLELLQKIRVHPALGRTPFILLTGRGDRDLVMRASQAGANNFIVKPFSNAMLRNKLEAVVGKLD